jgi:hypothetical protein
MDRYLLGLAAGVECGNSDVILSTCVSNVRSGQLSSMASPRLGASGDSKLAVLEDRD